MGSTTVDPWSTPYESFYGFVQPPFTLTPDPRFLYRSGAHEEALTLLLKALQRKEGFIVLTGDIGTGKTTTCRALLQQLDSTTFSSLVLNPFLSVEELLREALLDFGVLSREAVRSGRAATASTHELVSALHDFLLSLMPINGKAVLIIDEAQHLTPPVLEQIRVLSNLETNETKLLQIILVGQLNLLEVLEQANMRQLQQRISLRATLRPLTREEVAAYVNHRLWIARGSMSVEFSDGALDTVFRFSGGVPRVINLLCDRSLMAAAVEKEHVVSTAIVTRAADHLRLQPVAETLTPAEAARRQRRWQIPVMAALALVGVVVAALAVWPLETWVDATVPTPIPASLLTPAPARALPAPLADTILPAPAAEAVLPLSDTVPPVAAPGEVPATPVP